MKSDFPSLNDPRSERRRDGRAIASALALSLIPAVLIARHGQWSDLKGGSHPSLFDDAMISMSYAKTLASGHGLVWFAGAPRVEGITNLLWTLVFAGVYRLGFTGDSAIIAAKVLGLATVWLAAIVAAELTSWFNPAGRPWTRFLGALVVAANVPLLFWAVQGLEVGLLTFLMLATCALSWRIATAENPAFRDSIVLAVVVVVGVVTRNDFAVVALAPLAWASFVARRRLPRLLWPLAGAALAASTATVVFRLWYFGVPLPNTYYLKVTGIPLGDRLIRGTAGDAITAVAYLLPGLVIIAACWHRLTLPQRRLIGLFGAIAAGQLAYNAFVGGDAWEAYALPNRYLTPAFVCVSLAAVCALSATAGRALQRDRYRRSMLLAACLAAIGPGFNVIALVVVHYSSHVALGSDGRIAAPPALLMPLLCAGILIVMVTVARRRASSLAVHATALVIVLLVAASPEAFAHGERDGGGNQFAEKGAIISDITLPGAKVAVGGAGASQYFSGRAMIDMLGKSDRHIANESPASPVFRPGHNKWDIEYSVGKLRPDVVLDPPDARLLPSLGYTRMIPKAGRRRKALWVRTGSPFVRWDRLVSR